MEQRNSSSADTTEEMDVSGKENFKYKKLPEI